jgi:glutamyl/glutaminyl-tRNA synthetase
MNHDVFFPAQYKEMGYQPHAMVNYLALLGWVMVLKMSSSLSMT